MHLFLTPERATGIQPGVSDGSLASPGDVAPLPSFHVVFQPC